jgi:hypothetical protein
METLKENKDYLKVNEYALTKDISLVSVYNRIKKGYITTKIENGIMYIDLTAGDNTPRRGRKPKTA